MMIKVLACIALPVVAGVHRFMADCGYRYLPYAEAMRNAVTVAAIMEAIIIVAVVVSGGFTR